MLPIDSVSSAAVGATNQVNPEKSADSKPVDSAEQQKLQRAAGDFEAILLSSMWKSMKEAFGESKDDQSDPASGTIDDWGIEVMSGAVGKARALGIGNLILQHLGVGSADHSADQTMPTAANVFGKIADK